MKKALYIGIGILVVVLGSGAAAIAVMKSKAQARFDVTYDVKVDTIPIPFPLSEKEQNALAPEAGTDDSGKKTLEKGEPDQAQPNADELQQLAADRALERGKRYLESRAGCAECHGEDYGGKIIVENGAMGKWVAPNITRGGLTKDYKPEDWVRIIRHGILPDGRAASMPSLDFTWFSDQEVSDIAHYISRLPPVDRVMPPSEIGPVLSMLIVTDEFPISAEILDHEAKRPTHPPELEPTAELGKHLATTCIGCHGPGFSGGAIPGGDPAWPEATNLTPHESGLGDWNKDQFRTALREGKRPDGSDIRMPMPIAFTKNLKDEELDALFLYLSGLEPKPRGNR